jgi:ribose transport system permease protein
MGTSTLPTAFTRFSGLFLWALFIVIFALWVPDTFLTKGTGQSIAETQAVTGLAALGVVCAMAAGAFDLSFAGVLGLSSTIGSSLMARSDVAPALAIVVCLALGLGVGLVNGLLVTKLHVPSVVATLGMSSLLLAADNKITNGEYIDGVPPSFGDLAAHRPLGVPIAAIFLFVAALAVWALLEHSRPGRRLYATGMNPDAARLSGVRTSRFTILSLMLSSGFAAVAGLVLLAQVGSGTPNVGQGYLLPVFAAVFLGATQVRPGRFNVWGTILAIYLLATGVQGLQLAGGQYWVNDAFNGAALLIAVAFAELAGRRRGGGLLRPRRPTREATRANVTVDGAEATAGHVVQRTPG